MTALKGGLVLGWGLIALGVAVALAVALFYLSPTYVRHFLAGL